MQAIQTPTLIPLAFAAGGAFNTIPEASQIGTNPGGASLVDGFPPLTRTPIAAGGIPPSGLDMNGILNLITQSTRWAHAGGRYAYSAAFAGDTNVGGYPSGAMLMSADGQGTWLSLADNNSDNPDTGPGTKWAPSQAYGFSAISGLTNTNVTLTPAQAMKSRIVLTGALTGNVQVILPTWTREWTVVNNTTGAFSITAKTASGTGVVIPAGPSRVVGDGTNITQPAESIAGATLASHALTAGQIGAIGSQGSLPINTSAKINGVNNPNLLFNGSGEFGSAGWSLASGFFVVTDNSGGFGTFFSNTAPLSGVTVYNSSSKISIGPSVSISASVDISTAGVTSGGVLLYLQPFDSSGSNLGGGIGVVNIANGVATTRYSLSATTPSGTASVSLVIALLSGLSASAFGVTFRRCKVEAAAAPSLYSQEASIAAIGSSTLAPVRVRLAQNTTFYVNGSTGNDSNSGLSSGAAFATIQRAWDVIKQSYDLNGFVATISVASGTYTTGLNATGQMVGNTLGTSGVLIVGNSATINVGASLYCFNASQGARFTVQGFTMQSSGSSSNAIQLTDPSSSIVVGTGNTFGAFTSGSHMLCTGGQISVQSPYTVSGGASYHLFASNTGATVGYQSGLTVTVSGTPAFSQQFAASQFLGLINAAGTTFSGSATGTRYLAAINGVINTNGGGASFFPGSVAGSTSSGGIYV